MTLCILSDKMWVSKGFTLIELLIVVLILSALSAIAIPRIAASSQTAKTRVCETNVDTINSQIELWAADPCHGNGSYPTSLSTLTGDAHYFPDGVPVCPLGGTYILGTSGHVSCTHSRRAFPRPVPVEPEPVEAPLAIPAE